MVKRVFLIALVIAFLICTGTHRSVHAKRSDCDLNCVAEQINVAYAAYDECTDDESVCRQRYNNSLPSIPSACQCFEGEAGDLPFIPEPLLSNLKN
jgi:hypothetical protein